LLEDGRGPEEQGRRCPCDELCEADAGRWVRLAGWVQSIRDHGGLLFLDLRDREGITQIVCEPDRENLAKRRSISGFIRGLADTVCADGQEYEKVCTDGGEPEKDDGGLGKDDREAEKDSEGPEKFCTDDQRSEKVCVDGREFKKNDEKSEKDSQESEKFSEILPRLKEESVVEVFGTVRLRPPEARNGKMATGGIEVLAEGMLVHNFAATLPFPIDDGADKVHEELRLSYRYLDLRRRKNLWRLRLRHRVAQLIRHTLDGQGFIEIETPLLFKSTPEGAREFLVPSRLNPGSFYALNQSPQQYKQMLMVAGVERYYSLARCFRDEDLRADRQPEFTQIDLEMSFVRREDIYALIEGLLAALWRDEELQEMRAKLGKLELGFERPLPGQNELKTPFRRMDFGLKPRDSSSDAHSPFVPPERATAMDNYGSDKPDTRWKFLIQDVGEIFRNSACKVFRDCLAKGGVIKALNLKGLADLTAGEQRRCEELARSLGAGGLAYIKCGNGGWKSPLLKFFSEEERRRLGEFLGIEEGDLILFAADFWERACAILGRLRLEGIGLLRKRGRIPSASARFEFLWVENFPLVTYQEEKKRHEATHHPFTAPLPEDEHNLRDSPESVRSQHYDLVLNGVELGGGSIRIHEEGLQRRIFEEVLRIPPEVVEDRFGYMLKAFRYGAPPHGGIALGLDRLVAMLAGADSIRDVMAFPKTQSGQELMTGSPTPVPEQSLRELWIQSTAGEGVLGKAQKNSEAAGEGVSPPGERKNPSV
jgi:aspartyl-tRNA synthetase